MVASCFSQNMYLNADKGNKVYTCKMCMQSYTFISSFLRLLWNNWQCFWPTDAAAARRSYYAIPIWYSSGGVYFSNTYIHYTARWISFSWLNNYWHEMCNKQMSEQRKVERPMLVVTESKLAWNQFEKEKIGLSTVISTPQMLVLKALWGTNG